MTTRIFTPTDLDNCMTSEVARHIDVDAPEEFFQNVFLLGVYKDGRFEIFTQDDRELTLRLQDCKVFPAA